jgi:dTDP-4-dehydrorhamnose reductase
MTARPVLLIGASGQLGEALALRLARHWPVVKPSRTALDLGDLGSIETYIEDLSPSLIVNAAAYTDVDRAEQEPETAMAVNGMAPGILGEEARRLGIPFIHFSTDYVFGNMSADVEGRDRQAYRESDRPAPLNVYGATKWVGEQAVSATDSVHLILRLSWIYARTGKNFLNTVRTMIGTRSEIRIVDDQFGCPTWADALADATVQILCDRWDGDADKLSDYTGLYHMTAGGRASWYEFARDIVTTLGAATTVSPISSHEFASPARRPAFSVLDTTRLSETFGLSLPNWKEHLRYCLAQ